MTLAVPLVLRHAKAHVLVPDGAALAPALARTTHLAVGAHPDDLEFMALHGILSCHARHDRWFCGVTCTDGAGSTRTGRFAHLTDAAMVQVRRDEQDAAARLGQYGAMLHLGYTSAEAKTPGDVRLADDLQGILEQANPRHVYMHNLADKQPTHVAVAMATLKALRRLPVALRPETVWACEVWRDLDWLPDGAKVRMDVSDDQGLGAKLAALFASQNTGKRYDLAVQGRRSAHATFDEPVGLDRATQVIYGMDLMPLVLDAELDPVRYVGRLIDDFRRDVESAIRRSLPQA